MKVDLLDAPKEDVRLEIIPLIDVIFCILTFFILAAVGLTRQQALSLDLPSAQTSQPLPEGGAAGLSERFYVSIDAVGQVYYEQQPIDLALLYDLLLQHQEFYPEGLIVLYASQQTDYGRVVQVLDLLRSVGGERVALATLPGESRLNPLETRPSPFGEGLPPLPGVEPSFPSPELEPSDPFTAPEPDAEPLPGDVPLEEAPESAPLGADE